MTKITTKVGNLLKNVHTGHIVSGCNAQGIMGAGFALAIKNKYPGAYQMYRSEYLSNGLDLGNVYPWSETSELVIWNAITQEGFGAGKRQCSYDAIETCFKQINQDIFGRLYPRVPEEIHIPLLGAGLGGGNWEIIREIIEQSVSFPTTLWVL